MKAYFYVHQQKRGHEIAVVLVSLVTCRGSLLSFTVFLFKKTGVGY